VKSRSLAEIHPYRRVVFASGLTPANVAGEVEVVRPFEINFITGAEFSPDAETTRFCVRLS
jgi:phosphoribosylanthranilate isomerase